jgi:hypothetical protein
MRCSRGKSKAPPLKNVKDGAPQVQLQSPGHPPVEKLQRLGISVEEANAIVESPASQKLVDNLNNGNIK